MRDRASGTMLGQFQPKTISSGSTICGGVSQAGTGQEKNKKKGISVKKFPGIR